MIQTAKGLAFGQPLAAEALWLLCQASRRTPVSSVAAAAGAAAAVSAVIAAAAAVSAAGAAAAGIVVGHTANLTAAAVAAAIGNKVRENDTGSAVGSTGHKISS